MQASSKESYIGLNAIFGHICFFPCCNVDGGSAGHLERALLGIINKAFVDGVETLEFLATSQYIEAIIL